MTWATPLATAGWGGPSRATARRGEIEPLVGDLHALDRDLARLAVERGALPLAGPPLAEVPAQGRLPRLVAKRDRPVRALSLAVEDLLAPVPELRVLRPAALEDDVGVLDE